MSISDVFQRHCSHVKVDAAFVKRIHDMERAFVNKKDDHIDFFGGGTTGVQVVRFTPDDFNRLFDDILEVDQDALADDIRDQPAINAGFKISSEAFGHACIWIMHSIMRSKYLNEELKQEGLLRITLYLNYRYLTSIMYNFFRYPANPETAVATYAALSMRFGLKEAGSWGKFLENRSRDIFDKDSIHYKVIYEHRPDEGLVNMLNDVHGRIKSVMINIYGVFMAVHKQGTKITTTSDLVELDGEIVLKDRVDALAGYTRYLKDVIPDKAGFVKAELVEIICDIVHTVSPFQFQAFLEWFGTNYLHVKDRSMEKVVDDVMSHAFDYMAEHRGIMSKHSDPADVMVKMRGTYTSSKQTSPELMTIKEEVESMITRATGVKNASSLASIRTAFCLYLILRALTKRYYNTH